jgi:hypothetical protein
MQALRRFSDHWSLSVLELVAAIKTYTAVDKHEALDNALQRYAWRTVTKRQLQDELRAIAGPADLRQALRSMVPQIDLLQNTKALLTAAISGSALEVERLIMESPAAGSGALTAACESNEVLCTQMLLLHGASLRMLNSQWPKVESCALDVARSLARNGHAPPDSAAALVILEGEGWTVANRQHMSGATRDRAEELAWAGSKTVLPSDAWNTLVIPRVLRAESGFVRFAYR